MKLLKKVFQGVREMSLKLYKIEYSWCEGEHQESFVAKDIDREGFLKDLNDAVIFARSLLGKECEMGEWIGKGYSVECLPEYYEQILYYLTTEKGYVDVYYYDWYSYDVNDDNPEKIIVEEVHNTNLRKKVCQEMIDKIKDEKI